MGADKKMKKANTGLQTVDNKKIAEFVTLRKPGKTWSVLKSSIVEILEYRKFFIMIDMWTMNLTRFSCWILYNPIAFFTCCAIMMNGNLKKRFHLLFYI